MVAIICILLQLFAFHQTINPSINEDMKTTSTTLTMRERKRMNMKRYRDKLRNDLKSQDLAIHEEVSQKNINIPTTLTVLENYPSIPTIIDDIEDFDDVQKKNIFSETESERKDKKRQKKKEWRYRNIEKVRQQNRIRSKKFYHSKKNKTVINSDSSDVTKNYINFHIPIMVHELKFQNPESSLIPRFVEELSESVNFSKAQNDRNAQIIQTYKTESPETFYQNKEVPYAYSNDDSNYPIIPTFITDMENMDREVKKKRVYSEIEELALVKNRDRQRKFQQKKKKLPKIPKEIKNEPQNSKQKILKKPSNENEIVLAVQSITNQLSDKDLTQNYQDNESLLSKEEMKNIYESIGVPYNNEEIFNSI